MKSVYEKALELHEEHVGKIEVISKVNVQNANDLSLAYSPGVAEPCRKIHENKENVYTYTAKGNLVAVVSDGTAVLGLGNIGPEAAMPVMEGKAVLFKSFAGVDAFPICLDTTDPDEIIQIVERLSPTFGGINLEDIASPNCFKIEGELKKRLNIPVFHDDQHGTAIVTMAGLMNALKIVNKNVNEINVVMSGAGAAGIAIVKLLKHFGVKEIIMCDTKGAIYEGRPIGMNEEKNIVAKETNHLKRSGTLAEMLVDADVFIGVSVGNLMTKEMVQKMAKDPIIFAMANPTPEIMPEDALEAGAAVVGTGRSDYPNQVNNVLAFPGIFRGALDIRATEINEEMKAAAVYAIADLINESELRHDYVIPAPFDNRVAPAVAKAVAKAAIATKVARNIRSLEEIELRAKEMSNLK